jgi:hypothetical protein
MMRSFYRLGTVLLLATVVPHPVLAQADVAPSLELGLGGGWAGHGAGTSGKALARVTISDWGVGVRLMAMDGERRQATSCFLFCRPIESFRERSALLYRRLTPGGYTTYVGVGVGLLTGRRFIGSSSELDHDVHEWGLSFDASIYIPPGTGFRFGPSVYGHVGSGGVTWGAMVALALTG